MTVALALSPRPDHQRSAQAGLFHFRRSIRQRTFFADAKTHPLFKRGSPRSGGAIVERSAHDPFGTLSSLPSPAVEARLRSAPAGPFRPWSHISSHVPHPPLTPIKALPPPFRHHRRKFPWTGIMTDEILLDMRNREPPEPLFATLDAVEEL